jgi:hypothetical protein
MLLRSHKDVLTQFVRSRLKIDVVIWNLPMVVEGLVRKALQEMVDGWNSSFVVAEEMIVDFCFYISPFQSTTSTARPFRACP